MDTQAWKDRFISDHIPKMTSSEIEFFKGLTTNPTLQGQIQARRDVLIKGCTMKDLIYEIVNKQGWHPDDLAELKAYSEAQYVHWLEYETDSTLLSTLREFRKHFSPAIQEQDQRDIGIKLGNALKQLAARSAIDRLRVKAMFGLDEGNHGQSVNDVEGQNVEEHGEGQGRS